MIERLITTLFSVVRFSVGEFELVLCHVKISHNMSSIVKMFVIDWPDLSGGLMSELSQSKASIVSSHVRMKKKEAFLCQNRSIKILKHYFLLAQLLV